MVSQINMRKIAKLPKVGEVLVTDGKESALIHDQDRVYVTPAGSLRNRSLTQDFRMAQVREIRGGPPFWLRLQFYHGIKEDPENEDNLSPTELVLSTDEDWVSSNKIIDNMRNYFQEFDDSLPDPPRMNSQIWFYRRVKTPCNVCDAFYAPHQDRQRYCHSCNHWYHLQCLGNVVGGDSGDASIDFDVSSDQGTLDIENVDADGLPAIFHDVLQRPTVRGHGGTYDWSNNWVNTGSGVQKGLVAKWRQDGECPESWLKLLGENFLEDFVMEKSWKWYTCPSCGRKI